MIDETYFDGLRKRVAAYDTGRREVIKVSGDALAASKRAIFALHRDDQGKADQLLADAGKMLESVRESAKTNDDLAGEGSYRAALEEYFEAKLYHLWLKDGKIGPLEGEPDDYKIYLAAASDLTGEIQRRQVRLATEGTADEVRRLRDDIEAVVGQLLNMDLGGYLRTKFDQAKNNLRRAEDVLYDVTLRKG